MDEETLLENELNGYDFDIINEGEEILGYKVTSIFEDSSLHDREITIQIYLEKDGKTFRMTAEGHKEISYDSWVDTNWFDCDVEEIK